MSGKQRPYDSTVARIAGNIASGYVAMVRHFETDAEQARFIASIPAGVVSLARAIVAEVERTEAEAGEPVMSDMQQHFVTFFSPGAFIAEQSQKPIAAWDVELAKAMARDVKERHGAVPFGFRFTTRSRGPEDLDSKVSATSPMYYLGGTVETLAEVKARATEKDRILVANMECNRYDRIVTNDNSWRWTAALEATDVVLEWQP